MAALLTVLMILGVFLVDQVRLTQPRDGSLKARLYVGATNHKVRPVAELVQDDTKA